MGGAYLKEKGFDPFEPLRNEGRSIGVPKETGPNVTKEIEVRSEPGRDNAISCHIKEKIDGETISVTHQVKDQGGNIIHQHQTHIGKYGTQRRFPEEWIEYPTIGD